MKHWTLDDIPWASFDPSKVDPDLLKLAKAAALVEKNGLDYSAYLANVFPDDKAFQRVADHWAMEEVQHGDALGRWSMMADRNFDFDDAFGRFREGFRLPLDATSSVRGSRAGELVARCIVEVGTSSYYTSLAEGCEEPVLKSICEHIAADEIRHYNLFYAHLCRYLQTEDLSRWERLKVALGRIAETDDDELSYAYYAANNEGEPYDRKRWNDEYAKRTYRYYRPPVIERGIGMALKAAGFRDSGIVAAALSKAAAGFMAYRQRRLAA
ncbi:MAG: ferritin-like domain-containing protein [Gemmatimonas sp.]